MKKVLPFIVLFVFSCTPSIKSPTITLTKTANNAIKFSGLDLTMIQALGSDSASTSAWQSLIPVYKMPKDTDLKSFQPMQPGKYVVLDSLVIFTPDTPLQAGQTYFARCYHFGQGNTLIQQIKARHKIGNQPYTDLILKQ